jgi:uncharacterized protein (TIGR02996 family)
MSDPQADAFLRSILRQPDDTSARLVFADWLDEQGGSGNEAWARYLRVNADENAPLRASDLASQVVSRLTIPVAKFLEHPWSLFRLLPAPNITVRLGNSPIPRSLIEFVPESVARENVILPLLLQNGTLFVAAAYPEPRTIPDTLSFILNAEVIALRGSFDDVQDAINCNYGQTETESVDCVSYESPLIGLEGDSGDLFGLFFTAFSRGATGFEMELVGNHCQVTYYPLDRAIDAEDLPATVFHRLLAHLKDLPVESETAERGSRRIRLDIPLLSGRRFPVCVTIQRRWFRTRRFRVDFEWDR